MNQGKAVFAQIMQNLPLDKFHACVKRYNGNYKIKEFSCLDQFYSMAFAQLTYRESLRDIEACLGANPQKLWHIGIRCAPSRNNLSNANNTRNWQIYADLAVEMIKITRSLYANDKLEIDLENTIYALDATTIDLCLSVFNWADFRSTKAGVKMHTLLDLRGNIPSMIYITNAKYQEVNWLDDLPIEIGAIYLMDRGYLDFARLYRFTLLGAFFVIRTKKRVKTSRIISRRCDKNQGVVYDWEVLLSTKSSHRNYPKRLRQIKYKDAQTGKILVFLTNNFELPAQTIAALYKQRWQVELFFKWIKQHLRIKAFYGISENAVKTQIWIAVCAYLLVAILKKRTALPNSMHQILQIISLNCFEKTPVSCLLQSKSYKTTNHNHTNQLNLFN